LIKDFRETGVFYFFVITDVSHTRNRGLGLAIALEAVRRIGGTLAVESEANQGSRFYIRCCFCR